MIARAGFHSWNYTSWLLWPALCQVSLFIKHGAPRLWSTTSKGEPAQADLRCKSLDPWLKTTPTHKPKVDKASLLDVCPDPGKHNAVGWSLKLWGSYVQCAGLPGGGKFRGMTQVLLQAYSNVLRGPGQLCSPAEAARKHEVWVSPELDFIHCISSRLISLKSKSVAPPQLQSSFLL